MKHNTKTEARVRILRNAAEVCRLENEETPRLYWASLEYNLKHAADTIEREASDD